LLFVRLAFWLACLRLSSAGIFADRLGWAG
jgi:hypothetical protein